MFAKISKKRIIFGKWNGREKREKKERKIQLKTKAQKRAARAGATCAVNEQGSVCAGGRPLRHRRPVKHQEELLLRRVARDVVGLAELVCVLAAGDRVEGDRRNALRDCNDNVVNPGFVCSYQSTQCAF